MVTLAWGGAVINALQAWHNEDAGHERAWVTSGDAWHEEQPQATKRDRVHPSRFGARLRAEGWVRQEVIIQQ